MLKGGREHRAQRQLREALAAVVVGQTEGLAGELAALRAEVAELRAMIVGQGVSPAGKQQPAVVITTTPATPPLRARVRKAGRQAIDFLLIREYRKEVTG